MVKLLQAFEGFDVKQRDSAPAGALPPDTWLERGGRNIPEHAAGVWPKTAITMYAKVRISSASQSIPSLISAW